MARIFLSYRRDDSAGHTGRISDYLSGYFGQHEIFRDVEHIAPGLDFVQTIERAVASCEILIAVIGREWLTIADTHGQRRLDNPDDFVRLEVAAALQRNIRVIPVLVGKATMPQSDQLPEPLAGLARRNALELRDTSWSSDMDRLISVLETALAGSMTGETEPLGQQASARLAAPAGEPVGTQGVAARRAMSTRSSILMAIPIILLLGLVGGWLIRTRQEPQQGLAITNPGLVAEALPTSAGSSAIASNDLSGTYRVTGVTINGAAYDGTLKVSRIGAAYLLAWQIPNTYAGIGLQQEDVLSVAYGPGQALCSVVSYQVQSDGSLDGKWLSTGADKPGAERIVPTGDVDAQGIDGTYSIAGASVSGTTFVGSVTIVPRGPVYEFGWTLGSTTYQGIGIRQGNIVSVAWGTQPCEVLSYTVDADGVLHGQYSKFGTFLIGTEDAVLQ